MASINKVILIGNLGRDPELRSTASGTQVANFPVATSSNWTDKDGQRQEKTEWHRIVVWGKQAEICNQYLVKGKQVFIEGSLQTRSWEDRDGNKRYTTEVKAFRVLMLGRAEGDAGRTAAASATSPGASPEPAPADDPQFSDDDIPF